MTIATRFVMVIVWAAVALGAAPVTAAPTLRTYAAKDFSIDLPSGWKTTVDEAAGTIIAQQDPKRADAAVLIIVAAKADATADQVLDAVTTQLGGTAKTVRREAFGAGKLLVADAIVEGVQARIGAIAVSANGGIVCAALVSRTDAFDGLGGTTTVASVLQSMRSSSAAAAPAAAADAPAAAPAVNGDKLHGVYLGVDMRAVTGAGGRGTMEPQLVWYSFSSEGWYDYRWGPPAGLAVRRGDDSPTYTIANGQLEYVSRGTTYQRSFKRLGKDVIQLGHLKLTRVDKGYDKLTLSGTYRGQTVKRIASPSGNSYGSRDSTLVFAKNGKVTEQRSTVNSTDVTGETRGGSRDAARSGTYKIASNTITFAWSDGMTETRTFAIWDGGTANATTLVLDNAVYER